jgi:adenine-specific DNA methylase
MTRSPAISSQKEAGAYYTPDAIVTTLLSWAIHHESDRFLDPACGDGRFIAGHTNTVGIEQDAVATHAAMERAPWALIHEGDFFTWAAATHERFNAAGGNPPFIRYQSFAGTLRARALALCQRLGADFTGLTSSWAPFLVASAGLLQPGGRMAFVVPAEIGHAPYAAPLLEYLTAHFEAVHIIAFRDKLFPELSEDCWLLYAEGFGGRATEIRFTAHDIFHTMIEPPRDYLQIAVAEWQTVWNRRLRPFLMPEAARDLYAAVVRDSATKRLRDLARVGIGYVTGNNDFFHLRPSEAKRLRIPSAFLRATVRKSEVLPARRLYKATVERWRRDDDEILLLNIPKTAELPGSVRDYLDSTAGKAAREAYKCRMRTPWYSVPDVQTPDFFLSYMSGLEPVLVRNDARCTCTNSVHAVRFRTPDAVRALDTVWNSDFLRLSCELEGHPLGGGLLKLEPGEAARIVVPAPEALKRIPAATITEAVNTLRAWRHYAGQA